MSFTFDWCARKTPFYHLFGFRIKICHKQDFKILHAWHGMACILCWWTVKECVVVIKSCKMMRVFLQLHLSWIHCNGSIYMLNFFLFIVIVAAAAVVVVNIVCFFFTLFIVFSFFLFFTEFMYWTLSRSWCCENVTARCVDARNKYSLCLYENRSCANECTCTGNNFYFHLHIRLRCNHLCTLCLHFN